MYTYAMIKNNKFNVLKTKNLSMIIKKELGVFDYQDYLFDENEYIYLLVRDLSFYDNNTSITYRNIDDEITCFNGTVIFTRMNENGYVSLSDNDLAAIRKHLCQLDNGIFDMRYSID